MIIVAHIPMSLPNGDHDIILSSFDLAPTTTILYEGRIARPAYPFHPLHRPISGHLATKNKLPRSTLGCLVYGLSALAVGMQATGEADWRGEAREDKATRLIDVSVQGWLDGKVSACEQE